MKRISRRAFLQTTSTALVAGTVLNKVSSQRSGVIEEPTVSMGLSAWEYRRGSLGGHGRHGARQTMTRTFGPRFRCLTASTPSTQSILMHLTIKDQAGIA